MKKYIIALAIFFVSSLSAQVTVDSIRETSYDYACVDGLDNVLSNHQRQDKAQSACTTLKLNDPTGDYHVVGGRWRIDISGALAQTYPGDGSGAISASGSPPNDPPSWSDPPVINCTEGVVSSIDLLDDFVVDPEGDTLTLAVNVGGTAFPDGVTVNDTTKNVDCADSTTAGNTTGHVIDATDAAGSNTTVASPSFPISIASAAATGREDIIADEMVGYATEYNGGAGVTGGTGKPLVTVTNCNNSGAGSLRTAFSNNPTGSWIRFTKGFNCTISAATTLDIPPNTTIDGRGATITINTGGGFTGNAPLLRIRDDNIIVMYLRHTSVERDIYRIGAQAGGVSADGLWFHHISLTGSTDELFDLQQGTDNITISWCKLTNHGLGMLVSPLSTGDNGNIESQYDGISPIHLTMHHNEWDGVNDRHPATRHARLHSYNNLHQDWNQAGLSSRTGGMTAFPDLGVIVENEICDATGGDNRCAFQGANSGQSIAQMNLDSRGTHLLTSGATITEKNPGAIFTIPYSYTPDTADNALRTAIEAGSGLQSVPFPGDP